MFVFRIVPVRSTLREQLVVHGIERPLRRRGVRVDRVVAVHQISGSTIGTSPDSWQSAAYRASARSRGSPVVSGEPRPDVDHGAPLREPHPAPRTLQPLAQAVQALGHRLAREARERLGAGVDLDPGIIPAF
jgi:hypothetical protein